MKLFRLLKLNKEHGSATVEAIISFSGFLFVIFTILNVVNYCSAQMMISNAVDTATKELTQYAYFYKMSGLQKFSEDVAAIGEQGAGNLNDILGTTDQLYQSIGTAVDNSVGHATNITNAIEDGNFNQDQVQNILAGIEADGTNIDTAMNSVMSAFGSVQDNPMLYMKSIVAVAGNESLDTLKSHVIAAPLAKMFVAKHFGSDMDEANKKLEKMGVVGGLDGMNFKMSTIFSSDAPEDVHIVVYYKLKLVQVFDWATLEVTMCKESVARAWLGGDDVQATVTPAEPTTEESPVTDEGSSEGGTEEESEGTTEERTEEMNEEVDLTDSYWYLGDGGYGVENAGRDEAFRNLFNETYDIDTTKPGWYAQQKDSEGEYTGHAYYHDVAFDSTYDEFDAAFYLAEINRAQELIDEGLLPDTTNSITYVVYVPENIPDDEYQKMMDNISDGQIEYAYILLQLSEENRAKYSKIGVSIVVEKAGGNYDYGSEE